MSSPAGHLVQSLSLYLTFTKMRDREEYAKRNEKPFYIQET